MQLYLEKETESCGWWKQREETCWRSVKIMEYLMGVIFLTIHTFLKCGVYPSCFCFAAPWRQLLRAWGLPHPPQRGSLQTWGDDQPLVWVQGMSVRVMVVCLRCSSHRVLIWWNILCLVSFSGFFPVTLFSRQVKCLFIRAALLVVVHAILSSVICQFLFLLQSGKQATVLVCSAGIQCGCKWRCLWVSPIPHLHLLSFSS